MRGDKNMRIGLIGSAGTGRTTVALEVSKALELPFLGSHSITAKILDSEGYNYDPNIPVEHFLALPQRQQKLIQDRMVEEKKLGSFITDRTTLDHFAYALLVVHTYSDEQIEMFRKMCQDHMKSYTHLFYFKRAEVVKRNNLRTANKWFQMHVDFIIRGLLDDWKVTFTPVDPSNATTAVLNALK